MRLKIVSLAAALLAMPAGTAAMAQGVKEMQLIAAAQDCRASEVASLLDRGANINTINSGNYTPLMMAATYGCDEVARLLLDRGADASIRNPDFGTAADLAKLNGSRGVLAMLTSAATVARPAPPAPAAVLLDHRPAFRLRPQLRQARAAGLGSAITGPVTPCVIAAPQGRPGSAPL